ncbi:hypothetical protein ACFQE1_16095 [Halobium palmae]|uniref:Uncharacterized protein n=1 Tax=Halobium palmae TaxID=1776492 RepID=A0ABD5S2B8_9EURY
MPMETYTLRVAENASNEGISAEVLDEDGMVAETTQLSYGDYGMAAVRDGDAPDPVETEITADVTTTDLQFSRQDDEFEFRFLGDREVLATERVDDEDWGLVFVDE